ncbi:C40 family peptidase [Frigoribacterium sp. PvP032]|uniref:C40 family peptidase n=1 Tax=Frigoribacterium sp. PvP032 TaxID=2806589 RepID=UPI001AE4FE19|nr:C40 family peptidase [Frigoribacterium sp. PvP032]MBP1189229.1 cell wall-associated NlpC family hydrolase [Frigoribacterium sp. PvP032]
MTTTASPSPSGHDAHGRGGDAAPLLRPRGRRRAEAAVLPQSCRASFVQPEALVDASVAAAEAAVVTVPGLSGRRAARAALSARVERRGVLALARREARSDRPSAPAPVSRRLVGIVKKVSVVAALAGFAASGTLPLIAGSDQQAQAAAGGSGYSAAASASGQQHLSVDATVVSDDVERDQYSATSMIDAQTQLLQNHTAASSSEWDGRTTASYLADPLYDTLDRSQVLAVAMQYIGTPYVHGGEDPTKFDCSGLITFVYAQFGVKLTHYVPTQDTEGTRVSAAEAVPGDLVVFDNLAHDGIYAGNGMILDAPKPGGFVSVRPIWDSPHHFVRIGA